MTSSTRRIVTVVIYVVLLAGIAWQATVLADLFKPGGKYIQTRSYKVNVLGDVLRPGTYRVEEGTSQFEILKAAGVRPTSDLSTFNLMSAVDENSDLSVGSLDKQVNLTKQSIPVRVEFFFGDVLVTSKDGRSTAAQQGGALTEGSRITTESSSQSEISVGAFSRIDLDNFSDLSFDKIGTQEADRNIVEMFQKSGSCWYKVSYEKNNEQYRIIAPSATITVGGNGANFMVDIAVDHVAINLIDGLLLLERSDGGESINLIAGQTVTIYNDGRPFQIARLAPDLSAQERFSQLAQEKKSTAATNLPFNFMFYSPPSALFVVSVQFDKGIISIVHVPPQLMVEQFAEGIATLDEAYLYGGPTFVNSLLERILNIRLSKYLIFTRENVLKAVTVLGGVTTTIDAKASAKLHKPVGAQKLSIQDLSGFLSAENTTPDENQQRQRQVLEGIFEGLKGKSIVLTSVTTQQILSLIESNFSTPEVMDNYLKFSNGNVNWTSKDMNLPVEETRAKGRSMYSPQLDRCRSLLSNSL
jgi:hypothetical protein